MNKKLSTPVRVIGFLAFFLSSILMAALFWPTYELLPRIGLAAIAGLLCAAFAYGVLPTKKNIGVLQGQLRDHTAAKEVNYLTPSQLATSYLKWCAVGIAACVLMQCIATWAE